MASLIPSGSASGTGSVTLTVPTTNNNQTATLPDATGTVMVSGNMPAFAAYSSAGANISSSTWTKITLDTELYDTNNNFASSRFTPTVAGYYQINFTSTNSASGNNAYWLYDAIYKNGSAYIGAYSVFPSGNIQNFSNTLSQVIYMNGSSDYIEFYVNIYVPSGTPSYSGGASSTLASGCLLRAA